VIVGVNVAAVCDSSPIVTLTAPGVTVGVNVDAA